MSPVLGVVSILFNAYSIVYVSACSPDKTEISSGLAISTAVFKDAGFHFFDKSLYCNIKPSIVPLSGSVVISTSNKSFKPMFPTVPLEPPINVSPKYNNPPFSGAYWS